MNAPVAHRALLGAALTAALFAAGINVAQSQNEPTPAYPAAEKHKPTTLPDRIALTNEADPSTSQSVTWRTDATVKTGTEGTYGIAGIFSNSEKVATPMKLVLRGTTGAPGTA